MARTISDGKLGQYSVNNFRQRLLDWYDKHRRVLPWRALPGQAANPYHVWLSEIMLQQTQVTAVIPYFLKFLERWPRVQDLAAAPNEEVMAAWAGLGYYARARNLHKCAQVISAEHGGLFPNTEDGLRALPGVGAYTAAAIAAIAFDRPATVVDGNIERVIARWFAVEEPLPAAKKTLRALMHLLSENRTDRPGDFAQGMMDHGATVCIPKTPRCGICPLQADCAAYAQGIAGELPRRVAKKVKPQKFGYVYWIENEQGEILCETRPAKAMLGGMLALPTSGWVASDQAPPADLAYLSSIPQTQPPDLKIRHSFTHFDLELAGKILAVRKDAFILQPAQRWVTRADIAAAGFPTLFHKFVRLAFDYSRSAP